MHGVPIDPKAFFVYHEVIIWPHALPGHKLFQKITAGNARTMQKNTFRRICSPILIMGNSKF
jgi:hypothetical protein